MFHELDVILCGISLSLFLSLHPKRSVKDVVMIRVSLSSCHSLVACLIHLSLPAIIPLTLLPLPLASPQSLYSSSITLSLLLHLNTYSTLRSHTPPHPDQVLYTEHTLILPSSGHLKYPRVRTLSDLQLFLLWE